MSPRRLVLLALVVGTGVTGACAQTLLVNGDFESQPNFGINGDGSYSALSGSQIPGWTIVASHRVTIHNTTTYPFISGAFSVNMDGEGGGTNADLYQDFGTTLGTTYQLTFDWQGWQNISSVQLQVVVFNTVTSATLYNGLFSYDTALHHETATFVGTGDSYRLQIRESPESGINDNRFIVDNFVVTAIPEPVTSALAAGGTALAGALLRRRRRAHAIR